MKSYRTAKNVANAAVYVLLGVLAVVWVLPILYLVILSLRDVGTLDMACYPDRFE